MKGEEVKKDIVVCRCEDVTLEELEAAVDAGMTDLEEIKRFLHVGMGPCQGRTCGRLIARIVRERTRKSVSELMSTSQRPPLVSVPIRVFLGEDDE